MSKRSLAYVMVVAGLFTESSVQAQDWNWKSLADPRGEFVRLCAPHMVGRSAHPESVCKCLHDSTISKVSDGDLRDALMRGIAETGVPAIEIAWVPAAKVPNIGATFDIIANPTLQCMFTQAEPVSRHD